MASTDDIMTGAEGAAPQVISAGEGETVVLPEGMELSSATFSHVGSNLVVVLPGGDE